MRSNIQLPQFKEIDDQLRSIGDLANYDPLLTVVRERFHTELTHHLTSLKSRGLPSLNKIKSGRVRDPQQLREAYLAAGKEFAIIKYLFDMTKEPLSQANIRMLADILFGESDYRSKQIHINNVSGDRQKTPSPDRISPLLDEQLARFNTQSPKTRNHPITRAVQLHYAFTYIHPFSDWNGRIARLLLNVALMQMGCLPVLIGKDERLSYYEHLEVADKGDLLPLIAFIADKQLESIREFTNSAEYLSIQGKYELEERLQDIGGDEKCLVLTEDHTSDNLLAVILEASGFDMAETKLISYQGCSKIASANLFSLFVKEKMPHVHILVHRDRDYLTESELEYQHETFHRIDVRFFVTDGTDIESHFLNPAHLHQCYPKIDERTARAVVDDVILEVLPKSTDYLYKKEFGNRRETSTHLYEALVSLVEQNQFRFTHGKTAYRLLQHRVHDLIRKKPKLERPTSALRNEQLARMAAGIWKDRKS